MKKILCLILAMLMLSCLWACEKDADKDVDKSAATGEFTFGTVNGNTYKNDFLGLTCTLTSGWRFYSEDEILQINGIVAGAAGDELATAISSASLLYDMYAIEASTNNNINMNLQKLTESQKEGFDIQSALEGQIGMIKSGFNNMGAKNVNIRYQQVEVDGKSYDGLVTSAKVNGINLYQRAFSFLKGDYLVTITVTAMGSDTADDILGYISFDK